MSEQEWKEEFIKEMIDKTGTSLENAKFEAEVTYRESSDKEDTVEDIHYLVNENISCWGE